MHPAVHRTTLRPEVLPNPIQVSCLRKQLLENSISWLMFGTGLAYLGRISYMISLTRPTVGLVKARWVYTVDTGPTWNLSVVGHGAYRSRHHLEVFFGWKRFQLAEGGSGWP